MVYLSNAFSLQMQGENECSTRKCSIDNALSLVVTEGHGPYIDLKNERDDTVVCRQQSR